MSEPTFLNPFVLPGDFQRDERRDHVDLYFPDSPSPSPAVVFVPGGPLPESLTPKPRDWPVYRGYGGLAASHGAIGAPIDLRLHQRSDFPRAADDVFRAVELLRSDSRVDPDRISLWFFCGGGPLISDWLRDTPPWLKCVAATYPVLGNRPDRALDPRFLPAEAITRASELPIILTRVGLEAPPVAKTVEEFVVKAHKEEANLTIIDVPNGQHGYDFLDYTQESREAVRNGMRNVLQYLK